MALDVKGLEAVQAANQRLLAAVKPSGALGRAVQYGTLAAQQAAIGITHVDTGALRASHRNVLEAGGLRGRIYIDPTAQNPRSGKRTAVYGPMEHARGSTHSFYRRVVDEHGQRILNEMARIVITGA